MRKCLSEQPLSSKLLHFGMLCKAGTYEILLQYLLQSSVSFLQTTRSSILVSQPWFSKNKSSCKGASFCDKEGHRVYNP